MLAYILEEASSIARNDLKDSINSIPFPVSFGNVINQPGQSVGDANCWATAAMRQYGVDALRAGVEEFKDRDSIQPA